MLKLYAGGNQDRWDIAEVLALGNREELVASVDAMAAALGTEALELWQVLRA